jgi:hypothetical protein
MSRLHFIGWLCVGCWFVTLLGCGCGGSSAPPVASSESSGSQADAEHSATPAQDSAAETPQQEPSEPSETSEPSSEENYDAQMSGQDSETSESSEGSSETPAEEMYSETSETPDTPDSDSTTSDENTMGEEYGCRGQYGGRSRLGEDNDLRRTGSASFPAGRRSAGAALSDGPRGDRRLGGSQAAAGQDGIQRADQAARAGRALGSRRRIEATGLQGQLLSDRD